MPRIGVYGGSFNPVHRGHLHVALLAREAAVLDEILFVPAADPPHKEGELLAPAAARVAMLEAALRSEPGAAISTVELEPGGPRYTVDTLARLSELHPEADLYFVMGQDSLRDLPGWREPERILREHRVIAVDRPGAEPAGPPAGAGDRCLLVQGNPFAISSTLVRHRVLHGLPIRHLVPSAVEEIITERRLYRPAPARG